MMYYYCYQPNMLYYYCYQPNMPNEFKWTVSRSSILEDSYNAIMAVSNAEFLKSRLYVIFRGESGLDYGGLAR